MTVYPNARTYLQAVQAHYRSLENYSDTGLSSARNGSRICHFETQYGHPNLFRFAFESPHPYFKKRHLISRCVIGHDGTKPYFYASRYASHGEIDHPESLEMAVAGATGISNGTAHTIAALLFDGVDGFKLLDLKRLRFRRHRTVQGVPCIGVSGLHPFSGGRYTAWFGANDMLLRRLWRNKFRSEELRFNPSTAKAHESDRFRAPVPDAVATA